MAAIRDTQKPLPPGWRKTAALTYCCGNTALWYTPSGQPFGSFSSKMTHKFTTWASNSTPGYLPKNENICGTKTYTWMFIAALTVMLSNCRKSIKQWMAHSRRSTHTVWGYAATTRNQGLIMWPHGWTTRTLCHTKGVTYKRSHITWFNLHVQEGASETEYKRMATWGQRGNMEWLQMGMRDLLGVTEMP